MTESKEKAESKARTVVMPQEMWMRLERASARHMLDTGERISVSQLVRDAIASYVLRLEQEGFEAKADPKPAQDEEDEDEDEPAEATRTFGGSTFPY